jgi:hypothetical protein
MSLVRDILIVNFIILRFLERKIILVLKEVLPKKSIDTRVT